MRWGDGEVTIETGEGDVIVETLFFLGNFFHEDCYKAATLVGTGIDFEREGKFLTRGADKRGDGDLSRTEIIMKMDVFVSFRFCITVKDVDGKFLATFEKVGDFKRGSKGAIQRIGDSFCISNAFPTTISSGIFVASRAWT